MHAWRTSTPNRAPLTLEPRRTPQTLTPDELQKLTLVLSNRAIANYVIELKHRKTSSGIGSQELKVSQLASIFERAGLTEDDLDLLLKILKLQGIPNDIFQLFDKNGVGLVMGGSVIAYLNMLAKSNAWIKEYVDQTVAAVYQYQRGARLDPAEFARCLIAGGFGRAEIQKLYQLVKKTHSLKMPPPEYPTNFGVDGKDLVPEFNCDVRDRVGQFCVGMVRRRKGTRVEVRFLEFGDEENEWLDVNKDSQRFAGFGTFSSREQRSSFQYNQRVWAFVQEPSPPRWRSGRVSRVYGCQVQVVYKVAGRSYKRWVIPAEIKDKSLEASRRVPDRKKRIERTEDGKWWVNQIIEVLDTAGRWEPAQVLSISGIELFVHYVNWGSRYDEWVHTVNDAFKLRPLGAEIPETERERQTKAAEKEFRGALRDKFGFEVVNMAADGNCLFRSFAFHVYGSQEEHAKVRAKCYDYLESERERFCNFIGEDFKSYVAKMRRINEWGGHVEIVVMRELFGVNVEIYHRGASTLEPKPIGDVCKDIPMIRLSFHGKNHYNSVVDPKNRKAIGESKARSKTVHDLTVADETKSGGLTRNATLERTISEEIVRRGSINPSLKALKDIKEELKFTEYDYLLACQSQLRDGVIPLGDSLNAVVTKLVNAVFAKKIKKSPEKKTALGKLRGSVDSMAASFVKQLPSLCEVKGGGVGVQDIIKNFESRLLEPILWRMVSVVASGEAKPPSASREDGKAASARREGGDGDDAGGPVEDVDGFLAVESDVCLPDLPLEGDQGDGKASTTAEPGATGPQMGASRPAPKPAQAADAARPGSGTSPE